MPGFQSHVEAMDVDRDGDDDLILGHRQGSSIWTLTNHGDETFGAPVAAAGPSLPTRHAILDFDQDGWQDVAVASVSRVIALLRNDHGTLLRVEDLPSGVVYEGPQVADLDGNGYPDLIACRVEDDTVSVWLNANGPTIGVTRTPAAVGLTAEISPNPATHWLNVVFDLPRSGNSTVELWDVQGRRIESHEAGDLGPGRHTIRLGSGAHLAPGVYLIRLIQGQHTFTTRACLVE